jgi:hypothetical protein
LIGADWNISQKIGGWFMNCARKRGKMMMAKYTKRHNWYSVAASKYKKQVIAMVEEESPGLEPRSKEYLGHYQKALKEHTEGLDEGEREELETTAAEWNGLGPPEEVKRRSVTGRRITELSA